MTERGRVVAEKVVRRIGEVTPENICALWWDGALEFVVHPSDTFMDALYQWEQTDTDGTRERLQAAADDLVRAWRRAGQAWDAAGRPRDRASRSEEPAHA